MNLMPATLAVTRKVLMSIPRWSATVLALQCGFSLRTFLIFSLIFMLTSD